MSKALAKIAPPVSSVALINMNVGQLADACRMLDACQERYDKLSGICATMRGLVLLEAKRKLEHGKFLPWLSLNFKKHRTTAAEDMRIAREFAKCSPTLHFESLGRDLAQTVAELEDAQIDLKHPFVREVAVWVEDRSRAQLLFDFPASPGGHHYDHRLKGRGHTTLTPKEQAREKLFPAIRQLTKMWMTDGLWVHLSRESLRQADIDFSAMSRQIKEALK